MVVSEAIEFEQSSPFLGTVIKPAVEQVVEPLLNKPLETRWKCHTCYSITNHNPCPECGEVHLIKMCFEDHTCRCVGDIHSGVNYCEKCGQPICPCGCHNVVVISRVTGYLSSISGWNASKLAEFKDRDRYNLVDGMMR
jgi:hypothetical protein